MPAVPGAHYVDIANCLCSEVEVEVSEVSEYRLPCGNGCRPQRPIGICFPKYENTVYITRAVIYEFRILLISFGVCHSCG